MTAALVGREGWGAAGTLVGERGGLLSSALWAAFTTKKSSERTQAYSGYVASIYILAVLAAAPAAPVVCPLPVDTATFHGNTKGHHRRVVGFHDGHREGPPLRPVKPTDSPPPLERCGATPGQPRRWEMQPPPLRTAPVRELTVSGVPLRWRQQEAEVSVAVGGDITRLLGLWALASLSREGASGSGLLLGHRGCHDTERLGAGRRALPPGLLLPHQHQHPRRCA